MFRNKFLVILFKVYVPNLHQLIFFHYAPFLPILVKLESETHVPLNSPWLHLPSIGTDWFFRTFLIDAVIRLAMPCKQFLSLVFEAVASEAQLYIWKTTYCSNNYLIAKVYSICNLGINPQRWIYLLTWTVLFVANIFFNTEILIYIIDLTTF